MTSTTVKFIIFCALITLSAAVNAELKRINKHKEFCPNSWENCFVTFDAAGTPSKTATPPSGVTTTGKNIFPLTAVEIIGVILLIVIAGLANSGGVGGGPLLSSILMIFFSYSPNVSSQVVYTLVFGGSLGNYLNLVTRINPETRRPLIDYDLSLLCMPPMVFGANIGILIERVTAPLLLIIGIVTVTSYSFYQILRNALDLFKRESKRKTRIKEAQERGETLALADAISREGSFASENADDKEAPLIEGKEEPETSNEQPNERAEHVVAERNPSVNSPHKDDSHVVDVANINKEEHELDEEAKKFIKGETTLFPAYKYGIMLLLLLFVMATAYLKGTDEFPSSIGVAYCSPGYWGLFLLSLVSCVICFFLDIKLINNLIDKRVKYRHVFKQHPFKLTKPIVAKLTGSSLIAGFLAGWLGIGGGMIMKPTLLNVGVATQTVSSTAGFFVLQTSFVTLFQALLYQDISYTDQAFFFLVSFFGSFMVSWTLNWLIKKYKRPSIILFALIFVLFISILATPIFEVSINLHHMSQMTQFGTFC